MSFHANFLQTLALLKAWHTTFDQQQAGAFCTGRRVGLGNNDDEICVPAIGDEGLRSIEHEVITSVEGGAADSLEVGSGSRLAHCDSADNFAAGHCRQIAFFLSVAAVAENVGRHDFVVQTEAQPGETSARNLFKHHHRIETIGVRPAILLGHRQAKQSVGTGLGPDAAVDIALLFPLGMMGRDFLVEKLADGIAKLLMLFAENGTFDHLVS